jgi:glycosyltransferase involved in cell wall biosynthesis
MKIGIYQQDVSRIGGSISTILQFADCFKELGHDVKIHSSFNTRFEKKLIKNKEDVISFYNCRYLNFNDFIWDLNIKNNYDLCFTRGIFQKKILNTKHIIWTIVPNEIKHNPNLIEYWTNSNTTKNKINKKFIDKVKVVQAPHDYSLFRNNITNKKYDIVSILRGNDFNEKGLPLYAKVVNSLNCKSLLITTYTSEKDLRRIQKLDVPFVLNQSREQVSKILGQSKLFFFPSYNESCPLVIYEAMNSGLTIVSRDVGAVREQIGNMGYIFKTDEQSRSAVINGLNNPLNEDKIIERGLMFDRKNLLFKIKDRLNHVKNR